MAKNSCAICPMIRTQNGELVESQLFKDLLSYSNNNRKFAVEMWELSRNKDFKDKLKEIEHKLDANGEITAKSLLEITDKTVESDKVIKMLESKLGEKSLPFEQAVLKVQNFNTNSEWNKEYLATMIPVNGKYKINIEKRTDAAVDKLKNTVKKQSIKDQMVQKLAEHGLAVDFVDDPNAVSHFTNDVEKSADGFHHAIQIARGEYTQSQLDKEVCHEAGHFAINSLRENPLVTRLLDALNADVIDEVQKSRHEENQNLGPNPRLEVAGALVGDALLGKMQKGHIGKLVSRVVNLMKRIYYGFRNNEVKLMQLRAEKYARQIANEFMEAENGSLSLSKELGIETLFHREKTKYEKTYESIKSAMQTTINKLEAANSDFANEFKIILDAMTNEGKEAAVRGIDETMSEIAAVESITAATQMLYELLDGRIGRMLDKVQIDDVHGFRFNMVTNAKLLRDAHMALKTATNLIEILNGVQDAFTSTYEYTDTFGTRRTVDMSRVRTLIDKFLNNEVMPGAMSAYNLLLLKEREFFTYFLKDSYGDDYVRAGTHAVFNWKNLRKKGEKILSFENGDVKLEDIVTEMKQDDSLLDRFLGSMANSSDVINQIIDRVNKNGAKRADDKSNEVWDKLKAIRARAEMAGISDPDAFYERFEDGKLTGNIISEVNTGQWEREFEDFKRNLQYEFMMIVNNPQFAAAHNGVKFEDMSDSQKALERDKYMGKQIIGWHRKHSVRDEDGRWRPSPNEGTFEEPKVSYANPKWREFTDRQRSIIGELMEIKVALDKCADDSMPNYRAPQFKGLFMNRVKNKGALNPVNYATTFGRAVREQFCKDCMDTDFGGEQNYINIEDDPFESWAHHQRDSINRLPLFGINKLSVVANPNKMYKALMDKMVNSPKYAHLEIWEIQKIANEEVHKRQQKETDQLDTDIYGSMLAYAGMAHRYESLTKIVDTLEIGREVLLERTVDSVRGHTGSTKEKDLVNSTFGLTKHEHTRVFNRLSKYMDKQIYGVTLKPHPIFWNIVPEKIGQFFSRLASKAFLGGNVLGGLVNLGTGVNEIFKEASSGEFYNVKDWTKATAYYWGNVVPNMLNVTTYGKVDKQDKLSLWYRKFNVLNDNQRTYREWHTRRWNMKNFLLNRCIMLPYSSGDHYMQGMSYLSMAMGTKLIYTDENGNVKNTSLWDAYERDDIEYNVEGETSTKAKRDKKKLLGKNSKKYGKTLKLTNKGANEEIRRLNYVRSTLLNWIETIDDYDDLMDQYYNSPSVAEALYSYLGIVDSDISMFFQNEDAKTALIDIVNKRLHILDTEPELFKTNEDLEEHAKVNSIINKLEIYQALKPYNVFLNDKLTDEERDYLTEEKEYDINTLSTSKLLDLLRNDAERLKWNKDDESTYMDRAREINDRLHGIYNEMDKTAFHQNIVGNMLLAMRGYALGMIQRRFGVEKTSVALHNGEVGTIEGNVRSFAKVLIGYVWYSDKQGGSKYAQRAARFSMLLLHTMFPGAFNKKIERDLKDIGFSTNQYKNLRRFGMDYTLILALWFIKGLLKGGSDGDDDDEEVLALKQQHKEELQMLKDAHVDKSIIKERKEEMEAEEKTLKDEFRLDLGGIGYYFATRLWREQIAFNSPGAAIEEWKTVGSTVPAALAFLVDVALIGKNMYGDIMYDYVPVDQEALDNVDQMLKNKEITKDQADELKAEIKAEAEDAPGKEYFYQKSGVNYEKGDAKWWNQILKYTPYYRSYRSAKYPRHAVTSFEFGRNKRK